MAGFLHVQQVQVQVQVQVQMHVHILRTHVASCFSCVYYIEHTNAKSTETRKNYHKRPKNDEKAMTQNG